MHTLNETTNQQASSSTMDASIGFDHEQLIEDDDYIDMDLNSTTHATEFEFKMSCNSVDKQPLTSPADELFYNGKLLPLLHHHSPCTQRGDNVVDDPNITTIDPTMESFCFTTPVTPCSVGCELSMEDYFNECSAQEFMITAQRPMTKHSWSKKLKFIKQSNIGSRLKSSKAYLKSIFRRNESSSDKFRVNGTKECSESDASDATDMKSNTVDEEKIEGASVHQRSLSGSIKWQYFSSISSSFSLSSSKFSSFSSFSSESSDELYGQPVLKRSSSVNSDIEISIQGAIAYCKKSQLERA